MTFETERLILRPWADSDAEACYKYASDPRVGPAAGWPVHTSVDHSLHIIRTVLSAPETYAVVPKEVGHAVGSVGIIRPGRGGAPMSETEAEIGYWIGVPYWGRGLIPEAARELMRHGFEDLGFHTIWCAYFDGNEKSRRVQEKCGFIYHHTNYDVPWPRLDTTKTEHVTRITQEEWKKTV